MIIKGHRLDDAAVQRRLFQNTLPDGKGCLLWTGHKDEDGYGLATFGRVTFRVHRLALSLTRRVPDEAMVCHHCDTPACCSSEHLYVGDAKTNATDRKIRDRSARNINPQQKGKNGRAKLYRLPVDDIVFAMRCSGMLTQKAAAFLQVSRSTLGRFLRKNGIARPRANRLGGDRAWEFSAEYARRTYA